MGIIRPAERGFNPPRNDNESSAVVCWNRKKLLNNSFYPKNYTFIVYRAVRLFWLSTTGAPLFMVKWVIGHFMVGFLVVGWGEIKCAERFVQTHKNSRCLADSLFLLSFYFHLFFTINSLYTKKFAIKTMFLINFIYFNSAHDKKTKKSVKAMA